ncbi:hypothetical protein SY88_09340 [Clostridiales bacterium PH28_bin88]|nr:hypothetical protein SY88_09340 [Clostridiales bacterium PH28_bin88]
MKVKLGRLVYIQIGYQVKGTVVSRAVDTHLLIQVVGALMLLEGMTVREGMGAEAVLQDISPAERLEEMRHESY